ncbi:MAG: hypothetical protein H0T12_07450 [Actinobacteria bacterium]|nr:hypothetical protein [Actinomycetota bacterium]
MTAGSVDELFGLPLEEFTSSRNELAAFVAARGDKAQAREIKSLRKPNVVAWTLNQLSRRHKEKVERLVATYGGFEAAPSAKEVRSATESRRQLVTELVDAARDILEEAGSTSRQPTLQKVSQALYAGGSEQDRELLLQARLVSDMGSPSLDSAFGLLSPAEEGPAAPSVLEEKLQPLKQEAAEAERSAAELEEAARRSEAEAERARTELADAEGRARRAATEAEAARSRAAEARIKLEESQKGA